MTEQGIDQEEKHQGFLQMWEDGKFGARDLLFI